MKSKRIDIKPLSVNAIWKGKRYKTKDYNKYERDVLFLLPKLKVTGERLCIYFVVAYSSRGADIDNFVKPFVDILQKKYDFNDSRIYELHVYKRVVPKGKEYVEFKITELE